MYLYVRYLLSLLCVKMIGEIVLYAVHLAASVDFACAFVAWWNLVCVVLTFCWSLLSQVMYRATITAGLSARREVVECLALLCAEFPAAVLAFVPRLSPDNMVKFMSVIEAVIESSSDVQTVVLCSELLRCFAHVSMLVC